MPKFAVGDRVRKTKGSSWQGRVCGAYSTSLTPEGYAVESEREPGSVQIYPAAALDFVEADSLSPADDGWIAWEGGECPVGPLVRVDVRFANGTSLEGEHAQTFDWDADDDEAIVAYRIVEARDE